MEHRIKHFIHSLVIAEQDQIQSEKQGKLFYVELWAAIARLCLVCELVCLKLV